MQYKLLYFSFSNSQYQHLLKAKYNWDSEAKKHVNSTDVKKQNLVKIEQQFKAKLNVTHNERDQKQANVGHDRVIEDDRLVDHDEY
jgi:hypothetical protein